MKRTNRVAFVGLAALGLLMAVSVVQAQTPDGETPASETVCDGESGAAFGLCNAYCEAMDCDSAAPQATESACERVRDDYVNITDLEVPCLDADPCSEEVCLSFCQQCLDQDCPSDCIEFTFCDGPTECDPD